MFNNKHFIKHLILLSVLTLTTACSTSVPLKVWNPSEYDLNQITHIQAGDFQAEPGPLSLPIQLQHTLTPQSMIPPLESNMDLSAQVSSLISSQLMGLISQHDSYEILPKGFISGVQVDANKVGVIHAKVRYFEFMHYGNEKLPYVLMATNNNQPLQQKLLSQVLAKGASTLAESSDKGFKEPTPYVEVLVGIEVQFELVRLSDQKVLVPEQTLSSFYTHKWGGDSSTSLLSQELRQWVLQQMPENLSLLDRLISETNLFKLRNTNQTAYLAQGHHLAQDDSVPLTELDLRQQLVTEVAQAYLEKISPFQKQQDFELQGGDVVAKTLIQGQAYEAAIVRIQGLSERTDADQYHLGLAYEATGAFGQAQQEYEQLKKKYPEDALYQQALKRVSF